MGLTTESNKPMEYFPRTKTDYIAIHCSATKPTMDIGEDEIRKWHTEVGWADIGYNIVIRRNGLVEIGRPLDYRGAHVAGFNDVSLGICLVGGVGEDGVAENNFTPQQMDSLLATIRFCRRIAPKARIQGHRDFPNVAKACPSFDVRGWLAVYDPALL